MLILPMCDLWSDAIDWSRRNCTRLSRSTMRSAMQPAIRGERPASISPARTRDSGETLAQEASKREPARAPIVARKDMVAMGMAMAADG